MGKNSNNNRRAQLEAQDKLDAGFNRILSGLSEEYDVLTAGQIENSPIIESKFNNAVGVALTAKHNVYGNRIYGEGDGNYRISDTGNGLHITESSNLKYGSIKTAEDEIRKEETYFLFRKGKLKGLKSSFYEFCCNAEAYYIAKSIKGAKKPLSNCIFNFYFSLVIFSLISVVTFFGFMLYSYIKYIKSANTSILASCVGGAKTLWIIFGISVLLTLIGAIVHGKKVEALRPTGKGIDNINYTMHCFIIAGLELLTVIFAALCVLDNVFGYTIGYLFYPLALACLVYPVVIFILLCLDKHSFSKEYAEEMANSLSEEKFKTLGITEQDIKNAAVKPDRKYINDIVLRNIASDIDVSVWNK